MATKTESRSKKKKKTNCAATQPVTPPPPPFHGELSRGREKKLRCPVRLAFRSAAACGLVAGLLLFAAAIELASRRGEAGAAQRLHFVAVRRRMTWGTRMPGITGCCRLKTADSDFF
uniref:Uncharacterized protein n=1 Tax=Oryza meridionalis TaxID=40149 RepID=A0A0E0DYZ1_9ORYZ